MGAHVKLPSTPTPLLKSRAVYTSDIWQAFLISSNPRTYYYYYYINNFIHTPSTEVTTQKRFLENILYTVTFTPSKHKVDLFTTAK